MSTPVDSAEGPEHRRDTGASASQHLSADQDRGALSADQDRGAFDRSIVEADDSSGVGNRPARPESASVKQDVVLEPKVIGSRTVAVDTAGPIRIRQERTVTGAVPDRETVLARERDRFGGMKLGSAFFGWLAATGLAVLLIAILAAAGVVFGVTSTANVNQAVQATQSGTGTAKTVGLVGAIVLLVILFLAYYCGGYVAGRMARFDGFRQGFAVWLWAIFTTAIIAAIAAIAGAKYNVLSQLNLPRIPVKEGTVTTVGLIAIAVAIVAALIGALLGGKVGTRFHRKVDAAGFEVAADRRIASRP